MADQQPPEMDADARRTIARLAHDTLPRLIERLARSDLAELEVRDDGWRIRIRRPLASDVDPAPAKPARVSGSGAAGGHAADRPSARPSAKDLQRGIVTSPAVGYFVPRDGVASGSKVRSGDVLGQIDVLGVRHEVVASAEGVIGKFEVQSGQAIEYGQPIARVDAKVGA